MLKKITNGLLLIFFLLGTAFSATGDLFKVTSNPDSAKFPQPVNFTLCLNALSAKPISCQNFAIQHASILISTTIPNKTYSYVGIRINTPGYTYIVGQQTLTKKTISNGEKSIASDFTLIGSVSINNPVTGTIVPSTPYSAVKS